MQIAILQHTPDTPPSFTTTWLEQNRHGYRLVKVFAGEPLPKAEEVDWLIVLGGGMNVDDEKNHPFLRDEKKLVEQVLKAEKSYLGLCLGGQMLARVMGAEVRKHTEWEVGWYPINVRNDLVGLGTRPQKEDLHVFHYHQDTFELPKGAEIFAGNSHTPNQGFTILNGSVVATQFHPEADEAWVRECAADWELPKPAKYVQSPEEMIRDIRYFPEQSSWFSALMSNLARKTQERSRK